MEYDGVLQPLVECLGKTMRHRSSQGTLNHTTRQDVNELSHTEL